MAKPGKTISQKSPHTVPRIVEKLSLKKAILKISKATIKMLKIDTDSFLILFIKTSFFNTIHSWSIIFDYYNGWVITINYTYPLILQ